MELPPERGSDATVTVHGRADGEDPPRGGCEADPAWREWLDGVSGTNDWLKAQASITPAEEATPRTVPYWPNPGKMKIQTRDEVRAAFLRYLDDWFYKELSSKSHLSFLGFAKGPAQLLRGRDIDEDLLLKYGSSAEFVGRFRLR